MNNKNKCITAIVHWYLLPDSLRHSGTECGINYIRLLYGNNRLILGWRCSGSDFVVGSRPWNGFHCRNMSQTIPTVPRETEDTQRGHEHELINEGGLLCHDLKHQHSCKRSSFLWLYLSHSSWLFCRARKNPGSFDVIHCITTLVWCSNMY